MTPATCPDGDLNVAPKEEQHWSTGFMFPIPVDDHLVCKHHCAAAGGRHHEI